MFTNPLRNKNQPNVPDVQNVQNVQNVHTTQPLQGTHENANTNTSTGAPVVAGESQRFFNNFSLSRPTNGLPDATTTKGLNNFWKNLTGKGGCIDPDALQEFLVVMQGQKNELTSEKWLKGIGVDAKGKNDGNQRAPGLSRVAFALTEAYKANYPMTGRAEMRKVVQVYIQTLVERCHDIKERWSSPEFTKLQKELRFWMSVDQKFVQAGQPWDTGVVSREAFMDGIKEFQMDLQAQIELDELAGVDEERLERMLGVRGLMTYRTVWDHLKDFPPGAVKDLKKRLADGTLTLNQLNPGSKTVLINKWYSGDRRPGMAWDSEVARTTANESNHGAQLSSANADKVYKWVVDYLSEAMRQHTRKNQSS